MIDISLYGKDHWSLLAYVETVCVDHGGLIDIRKLSCNPNSHPLLQSGAHWNTKYSTRLRGFFEHPDRDDPEKAIAAGVQLRDHDDWDCLEDLEQAGLINIVSLTTPKVELTTLGVDIAARLRAHKAAGQMFATFTP